MTYNILFAVVGIGLIAFELSLKRFEDSCRLDRAFKRIQALEDRLEGMSALVATLEEKLNDYGGEE